MISPLLKLLAGFISFMTLPKDVHSMATRNIPFEDLLPNPGKPSTKDFSEGTVLSNASNCNAWYHNKELKISCKSLNFSTISEVIPPETIHLEISDSFCRHLYLPFFSHLTNLRTLKLTNNSHRYVTSKAFTGLQNLKSLNLSSNHITVLLKTFTHTPRLEDIDFSNNHIFNFGTIANAIATLKELRNLTLNHNIEMSRILKKDLLPLRNSSLEIIGLFNTSLVTIEDGAFGVLSHLRVLDLSTNYLLNEAFENVTASLRNTSIEYFFARELTGLFDFPYKALTHLQNTQIRHLDISYNVFNFLPKFPEIDSLLSLWIPYCSIRYVDEDTFEGLSNLQDLVLNNNSIVSLNSVTSFLFQLKRLSVKNQVLSSKSTPRLVLNDFQFSNVSELSYLDLGKTTVNDRISRYVFNGLKSLETLILLSAGIEEIDDCAFETLSNLKVLDLRGNKLTRLTNYTFNGLKSLEILILSENKIKFSEDTYPFQNSDLIYILYLHGNDVQDVPAAMLSNLTHLRILSLYSKSLMSWNGEEFSEISNVTKLQPGKNQIINDTSTMILDRIFSALDFTVNPFNCITCGTKDFQDFFRDYVFPTTCPANETTKENGSYCSFPELPKGRPVLKHKYFNSHEVATSGIHITVIIAVVSSLALFTLLLAIPCYLFRWYVRYWVFHVRTSVRERRRSKRTSRQYLYDAFVCYNAADTPWVLNYMIPALEGQEPRLRLCIHERDFEVGRLITDNILDAIESSRKVILLLTDSFARSEWCMFELHLAQHKLFDDSRDALLIIKVENIDEKLYSKDLRYLERTRTCFTWTENPTGQKLFWNKIRKFFGPDILPGRH